MSVGKDAQHLAGFVCCRACLLRGAAEFVAALAFHRGGYHRLRVGRYRVVYIVEDDLITVERVDRVAVT